MPAGVGEGTHLTGCEAERYRQAKTAFIGALLTAENLPLFGAPPEDGAPSS